MDLAFCVVKLKLFRYVERIVKIYEENLYSFPYGHNIISQFSVYNIIRRQIKKF